MIVKRSIEAHEAASRSRLRFAIPKGALFSGAVDVLSRIGVDTRGLEESGRQLIVVTDDFEFVISKPSDIPIYVATGAADVGIAGADVLAELQVDVVEILDLGFGACKMVVAEPLVPREDPQQVYEHLGVIRVATKYPRITERHYSRKGVQVEVVKLNGNIEIAPLIGMADQIVDITQTGTTLRKNDLRIVEDVMFASARFIANPGSLRTRSLQVGELVQALGGLKVQ